MTKSDVEIAGRELQQMCFHEAAHELLVHRFGGVGDVQIWRNRSPGAIAGEEKAWLGQFRMFAEPGACDLPVGARQVLGLQPALPSHWKKLVGLAGLVAECMADEERDPHEVAAYIDYSFEGKEVSATDAALIGKDWNEADVQEVVGLLSERWPDLERRAAELARCAEE